MGKSSLLAQMAMAIASGKDIVPFSVDTPQKVMLVNVEDPAERIHDKIYQQKQSCRFSQSEEKLLKQNLKIVDTKSRLYGLEENNNDHATQWLFFLEKIVAQTGCGFIIAHHTGKGEGKRTGRGASAFDVSVHQHLIFIHCDLLT